MPPNLLNGMGYTDSYDTYGDNTVAAASIDPSGINFGTAGAIQPSALLVGIIAILAVMKLLSESEKTGLDPAHLGIGIYNLMAVSLMSIIGILFAKWAGNLSGFKPVQDIVNTL